MKPAGAACGKCPARDAKCVLPEVASTRRARLAIVGEGPGRNELEQGRPFVGRSGKMLERGLATIGLQRSEVHWTNAVLCECTERQLPAARKACAQRLASELDALDRNVVIIPVGAYALQSVLGLSRKPKILEWRGFVTHRNENHLVMPTIHPAFVMRAPAWAPVLELDVARIGRVLANANRFQPPEASAHIEVAGTPQRLGELLLRLDRRQVAIDVETVGLGPTHTALVCLAIADERTSIVIPWSTRTDGAESFWTDDERAQVLAYINVCLHSRIAVTHNGPAFDHIVLARYGIHVRAWNDTLLAAHVLASHLPKRLSHVVSMTLDAPPWKHADHSESIEDLWHYNALDSLYTAQAAAKLLPNVSASTVFQSDCVCAELCREMQRDGVSVDVERAQEFSRRLQWREAELLIEAEGIAGRPVRLLSPLDLGSVFFDEFKAPVFFRSEKTRRPSLGVDSMRAYSLCADLRLAALARVVLEFRRARKIRSTYLDALFTRIDSSGRVHPSWYNYGTVGGRWSCQNPNLMNLPRTESDPLVEHGGIRSIYRASEGCVFVTFDFQQLEMRMAAYVSGDAAMISACESSDLHSANAEAIFGGGWRSADTDARKQLRMMAKTAGFALAYLATAETVYARLIASGMRVTLPQIEAVLRKLRSAFSGYYRWQSEQLASIAACGYVHSPILGRRRWLGREPLATEAANFPIQSGAADLMNLRLPELVRALPSTVRLIAQVHDSATFEAPTALAELVRSQCVRVLTAPMRVGVYSVRFPIDTKIKERWA